jgi:hypothetical protein
MARAPDLEERIFVQSNQHTPPQSAPKVPLMGGWAVGRSRGFTQGENGLDKGASSRGIGGRLDRAW